MRIVHIDDEIWDSGLTEYALSLALAQKKAGHDVRFIAPRRSHALAKAQKLGLNTVSIINKATCLPRIAAALRAFKPDIINAHTGSAHTYAALLCGLSSIMRKFLSFPLILTFSPWGRRNILPHLRLLPQGEKEHTRYYAPSPPAGEGGGEGKVCVKTALIRTRADARPFKPKLFSGLLWARTHGFIAANSGILRDFKSAFGGGIAAETVFQGIDTPVASSGKKDLNKHVIGMAGRLDPVKGHRIAIEAMQKVRSAFPDALLRIAGEEKNVKTRDLAALAAELKIADAVVFEGFVENIFSFMNGCSLGIIASTGSEAVSRVALEWASQEIAVVASEVGGLGDIVENGKTGLLVSPANPDALADALISLLTNTDKAESMGKEAAKRFRNNFTPELFELNTRKFYEKVLCGIPS